MFNNPSVQPSVTPLPSPAPGAGNGGGWLPRLRALTGLPLEYALPGDPTTDLYIVPVSGGADSSVLAILLSLLFPSVPFVFVFTDTKADEREIYSTLDMLESFLGQKITRLEPEHGLFELIELQGGFLPNHSARWCTRILKLENFRPWLETQVASNRHMFIGIRADEQDRLAFAIDDVETHFPFIEMGVRREHVFQTLRDTIGVPRYYARRTRSGCSTCFYQRRSEKVGLLQEQPIEFIRGAKYEKLNVADVDRHSEAPALWSDSGIAENWQTLPVPSTVLKGGLRNRLRRNTSIFGDRGVFVGGEFFFDSFPGLEEFVWARRVVSYSPTLAGIKDQLDERFQHLLATSEVHDMTPEDVRSNVRFAIWYVELPADVFDPDPPTAGSYTWQKGESYKQLRHIIQWATRALQAEGMRREASSAPHEMSVQYEWAEAARSALKRLNHETGRVVQSMWYEPKETVKELTLDEQVRLTPCPMCSI